MSCPRCNGERIVKAGFYTTKLFKLRQRFRCRDCGRNFIILPHIDKLSPETIKKIIRLSKKINPNISKFSNKKNKTYSHREISKILNVSTTAILRILKEK